jgi:Major Facilitator Superfamily
MSVEVKPSVLAEAMFRREIVSWALLGLTLGLVEGATVAVLVKRHFADAASPFAVNIAVSFVSGAPALSNVISFVWANIAHGRERVRLMVALQALFATIVGLISLAPREAAGLALTVISVVAARVIWAGVLTVRAAVWTANYPRNVLARVTGRIVVVSSLAVAAAAGFMGWVLETDAIQPGWLYAIGAISGLVAAWLYRETRVRRQFQLLSAESAEGGVGSEAFSLRMLTQILREDPSYREYMLWMGLFGGGNLMLIAQLVVIFSEQLELSSVVQIALLSIVPLASLPIFMPWWARLFDGSHIVIYRSRQAWTLVISIIVTSVAVFTEWMPLLWIGSILLGAAYAGANLGWNLGHNDFASIGRAQHYMGVHVTLTGVRGALAPPAGVVFYEWLEALHAGSGKLALFLPLALSTAGALGFNAMRRAVENGIEKEKQHG